MEDTFVVAVAHTINQLLEHLPTKSFCKFTFGCLLTQVSSSFIVIGNNQCFKNRTKEFEPARPFGHSSNTLNHSNRYELEIKPLNNQTVGIADS